MEQGMCHIKLLASSIKGVSGIYFGKSGKATYGDVSMVSRGHT